MESFEIVADGTTSLVHCEPALFCLGLGKMAEGSEDIGLGSGAERGWVGRST